MLQAQACVFLLLRSGEADGGSTCSSVNAQQGDGSNLVAQGVEALGVAALGGELQDILSALVSILGQSAQRCRRQPGRQQPGSRPCPQSQQRTGTAR